MKFASKYKSYKIWLRPSYYRLSNLGERVFVQGVFAQFENGFFETDDNEVIDLIKKNKMFGVDFWSIDEPTTPNPEGLKEEKIKEEKKEELVTDCPKCGKTFKNKAGLMSHIAVVHKDETS